MFESVSSYALAAGVATLFNPCSLLLLPAWLTMVAAGGAAMSRAAALRWSVQAALVLSSGYFVAFSLALVAGGTPDAASGALAYVSAGTGMLLVLLASFLIAGGHMPLLQATQAESGAGVRIAGLAATGAVIGLASLAPQLPELLARDAAADGAGPETPVLDVIAYVLGLLATFGLLCTAASWLGSVAGRRWPASGTVLDRILGYLLLLAGLGTAYYAFYAVRNAAGTQVEDQLVDAAHGVHGWLTDAFQAVPAWLVVLAYLVVTGGILLRQLQSGSDDGRSLKLPAGARGTATVSAVQSAQPAEVRSRRRALPEQNAAPGATGQEAPADRMQMEEHRPRHFNPKALRRPRNIPSGPRGAVQRRVPHAAKPGR